MALSMKYMHVLEGYLCGSIHGIVPVFHGYPNGIVLGINACILWISSWRCPWHLCLYLLDIPMALSMEYVPVFIGYPYGIGHGICASIMGIS